MEQKPKRICFLADSHSLYDDRIYWKEALSMKNHGFDVYYLLAGESNQSGTTKEGIHYTIINKDSGHGSRLVNFLFKKFHPGGLFSQMFHHAQKINASVYHIHDLKVNRIGKKLKALPHAPKIVYDVHEPYPENIIDYNSSKGLIGVLNRWYSVHARRMEKERAKDYDLIITTEENLQQRFQNYFPGKPVEIIYNYTDFPQLTKMSNSPEKEYDAIYTGGITKLRGAIKILEAVNLIVKKREGFKMLFLGSYFPIGLKKEMESFITDHKLQNHVEIRNWVPYTDVADYYLKSRIGLGIFLPIPTHRIILQIKIFEYMNFGLPVVGSNFGHIHDIITRHQCGISVDPEDPHDIAGALQMLLSDDGYRSVLSQNAMQAVEHHYKWEFMEKKLVRLYNELVQR